MPAMASCHHLLLPFFLLLYFQLISGQNSNCTSSSCGDIEIRYPFWVPPEPVAGEPQPDYYCGHEDLRVTCTNNKTLTFNTSTDSYTVRDIDYTHKTISLVDTDVLSSECPRVQHDLDISNIPDLSYNPAVVNLTFFFGCENATSGGQLEEALAVLNQSTCLDDEQGKAYVLFGTVGPDVRDWLSVKCRDTEVVAPVLAKGVTRANVATEFPKMLRGGFLLDWKDTSDKSDCGACEASGGFCGYSNKSGNGMEFVCFCDDGSPHSIDCRDKSGKGKKIGIGVGVGLFAACVGVGVLCCCKRRKDRKSQPSDRAALVRSISSDPSALTMDTEYQSSHHLTHTFTYPELADATDGFHSSKELGDGGFGTVYKGELRDGRTVAVKRLYENNYRRMEQFMNEIRILSQLRHPNLVALYGSTSRQSRELLLVYEYVANGTVADHLHGSRAGEKGLTWAVRMSIAIESASALAYLHAIEPPIVHRDVKTHNILLNGDFHVKVGDFGLSRLFPLDVTHVSTAPQGTPGYVDPEYHQCYQLTDKSDVYSFGVVLVELISSKPAVDITRTRNEINLSNMAIARIRDGLLHELADPELGFECDPEATRMIRSVAELAFLCLQAERDMRPSMEEVKNELIKIAAGGRGDDVYLDVDKPPKDDAYLLHQSAPFSPDTVTAKWNSRSTTPNTSA